MTASSGMPMSTVERVLTIVITLVGFGVQWGIISTKLESLHDKSEAIEHRVADDERQQRLESETARLALKQDFDEIRKSNEAIKISLVKLCAVVSKGKGCD